MKTTDNTDTAEQTFETLMGFARLCSAAGKHRQCFEHMANAFAMSEEDSDEHVERALLINDLFAVCDERAKKDGMREGDTTDMFIDALAALR